MITRAYPRSRGATPLRRSCHHWRQGLSPLARGNPLLIQLVPREKGPIPARAGQPPSSRRRPSWPGAYPRSRGATPACSSTPALPAGLSPLARGNRGHTSRPRAWWGPIPARAGQPASRPHALTLAGAYPRSRGATAQDMGYKERAKGLSPLARGNRIVWRNDMTIIGPIPARAGQPALHGRRQCAHRAYPRSRGATRVRREKSVLPSGLSPLARGNRRTTAGTPPCNGPIPARAGQPP